LFNVLCATLLASKPLSFENSFYVEFIVLYVQTGICRYDLIGIDAILKKTTSDLSGCCINCNARVAGSNPVRIQNKI